MANKDLNIKHVDLTLRQARLLILSLEECIALVRDENQSHCIVLESTEVFEPDVHLNILPRSESDEDEA
jgi:hypothetical protein